MLVGHQKQWNFLKNKLERGQLSHAYLFAGADQLGKKTFAKEFIKLINCKAEEKKPCLKCVNCQMIEKNSFPDLMIISATDGGEIEISKAREAQNFLSYKSYYGSSKSVIIDNAEKMNQEAQNCFLKTLEEPKGKTVLILVSSKPDMLLSTIFSRCQIIKFLGRPIQNRQKINEENKIMYDVLRVVGSELSEKFKYAKSIDFDQQELSGILEAMQKYFRYLMIEKTGASQEDEKSRFSKMPSVLRNYPVSKLKEIIKLTEDINLKITTTNASPKLALEVLLTQI